MSPGAVYADAAMNGAANAVAMSSGAVYADPAVNGAANAVQ